MPTRDADTGQRVAGMLRIHELVESPRPGRRLRLGAGRLSCPAPPSAPLARPSVYFKMFTARAITSAVVDRAIALCTAMRSFAQRVNGIVSVGENAVALVKLT